ILQVDRGPQGLAGCRGGSDLASILTGLRRDCGTLSVYRCSRDQYPARRMLIVQKYGGTSVGSTERMMNVARRCLATQREGHDVAVVVSAMSGETNRLLKLVNEIHDDNNDREDDGVVSTGEQVSAGLVALAIRKLGGKARSFLGHQVKIQPDSSFARARILSIDSDPVKEA